VVGVLGNDRIVMALRKTNSSRLKRFETQNYREAQPPDINVCQKRSELGQINILNGKRALPLTKNVLKSTSYLLPLASKTSFTEWYAKPSRAPTHICLPCCAILACSKVGTGD
jgi:hypothetical protein